MSLTLNREIGGVKFEVDFKDKVCVMMGFSGTGKTYLLRTLKSCLDAQEISCQYISPGNLSELGVSVSDLKDLIQRNHPRVVLFDNASLYLTDTLFQAAFMVCDYIVVGTNYLNHTKLKDCGYYAIDFTSDVLRVMRESYA